MERVPAGAGDMAAWIKREETAMRDAFRKFANRCADAMGAPWTFLTALALVLGWALTGPVFHYSNTWQLVINTATTVVTFLMVFLIQNTQNRDARVIQLKLDELLRGVEGARTQLVSLENMSDDELAQLQKEFSRLHRHVAKTGIKPGSPANEEAGD
jgi:low affinity Fe/Cu permease